MVTKLANRIEYQLTKKVLFWALVIGLLFSVMQIYMDYRRQHQSLGSLVTQLINSTQQSAALAAFTLDDALGKQVVDGLMQYSALLRISITDDKGKSLVSQSRAMPKHIDDLFIKTLFSEFEHYRIPLHNPYDESRIVGHLSLTLDTYELSHGFIVRSFTTTLFGLLRNLLFSLFIIVIFNRFLTRPLMQIVAQLKQVDIHQPASTIVTPEVHQHDELGDLIRVINRAFKQIYDGIEWQKKSAVLEADLLFQQAKEAELLNMQAELTAKNTALAGTLEQLETMQLQLFEAEKKATMVSLTTGVAHEINTPLGISITATSIIAQQLRQISQDLDKQTLSEDSLRACLRDANEGVRLLETNLTRATEFIERFKGIAVDQYELEASTINFHHHLRDIVETLELELRKTPYLLTVECPADFEFETFPGAWFQIISNLVFNSLKHAFVGKTQGHMHLHVTVQQTEIRVVFQDDGVGIAAQILPKIFDPFMTTKRNQGGTGLGLNIVFNLVTAKFKGTLTCESTIGQGAQFIMTIPRK